MKKLVVLLLCLLIAAGCFGCKKAAGGTDDVPGATDVPTPTVPELDVSWIKEPWADIDVIYAMKLYNETETVLSGYLTFQKDGKWGVVDEALNELVPAVGDYPADFCDMGHLIYYVGSNLDYEGRYDVSPMEECLGHGGYLFCVCYDEDTDEVVIASGDMGYERTPVSEYQGGLRSLNLMRSATFSESILEEGLVDVEFYDNYGYCDNNGNIVIKPIYKNAKEFSCGLAAVCQNEKWGFIDTDGKQVTEFKYELTHGYRLSYDETSGAVKVYAPYDIYGFVDGFAVVCEDGKYGVIDTKGNEVIPTEYDGAAPLPGNRVVLKKDGLWGIAQIS